MKKPLVQKGLIACTMSLVFSVLAAPTASAALPLPILEVIAAGVKKAIRALDLKIQRKQNQVIWKQNGQLVIQNTLIDQQLGEIAYWTALQRTLYADYYQERKQVNVLIASLERIQGVQQRQNQLLLAYQKAWLLFQQEDYFSPRELAYMSRVYAGILAESTKNRNLIALLLEPNSTAMDDGQRMELLQQATERLDEISIDLALFNRQNSLLRLQRSEENRSKDRLKKIHGLP